MTFTENAVGEIIKIMRRDNLSPDNTAVRMGVKGGGCSGFTYTLDFEKQHNSTHYQTLLYTSRQEIKFVYWWN